MYCKLKSFPWYEIPNVCKMYYESKKFMLKINWKYGKNPQYCVLLKRETLSRGVKKMAQDERATVTIFPICHRRSVIY